MRLIDADALRADAITRSGGTEFAFDNCYPFWQFSQAIAQAPTIEAAPVVHGRWVLVKPRRTGRNATYKCTACGQLRSSYYNDVTQWKHCPCGARMDGDGKAPATPTTGSNYQDCKHCNSTFIGLEEYAECPECGHPFEEVANA